MKLTYGSDKDASNIIKHGLSLADALLVFDATDKLTLMRAISLRRASKQERELYAENDH